MRADIILRAPELDHSVPRMLRERQPSGPLRLPRGFAGFVFRMRTVPEAPDASVPVAPPRALPQVPSP
jgi:hypothetical protein